MRSKCTDGFLLMLLPGHCCALPGVLSCKDRLGYSGGSDTVWYPMAKLVHQGCKPFDTVDLQEASIKQENLLPHPTASFLVKFALGYHNLSTLTHMQDRESEKQETVPRSKPPVCIPGPKDVLWFSNGTKDAHMRQYRLCPLLVSHPEPASQAERWTGYGHGERTTNRSNHSFPSINL